MITVNIISKCSVSPPPTRKCSASPHKTRSLPFYPHSSSAIDRSSGYGSGGVNSSSIHGVRGLFTASQWMELEHQALIYKYITANVPIPSYLLNPIIKAFESSVGWGANFHLGFSNTDPEPGRCRRTDGKKWRCSRDAVPDQKYCKRHINRGCHRSRKPVEVQSGHSATTGGKSTPPAPSTSGRGPKSLSLLHRPEFGLVYSDSLLNPLDNTNYANSDDINDGTKLSISMITSDFISSTTPSPLRLSMEATRKGLHVGDITSEQNHRPDSWVPASWERSVGGPLGEALHTLSEGKDSKALNLIDNWDNNNSSQFEVFSPRTESSKTTLDGRTFCNGVVGPGLMLPSLPAL